MDQTAIAFKNYRDQQLSLESFQRVTEATFVALETNGLKTKKIHTFKRACVELGISQDDVVALENAIISMELTDIRRIMSKLAIGANIQKLLDFLIRLFERLIGGNGNTAADNAAITTSELNKINKEFHTRKMPFTKPRFANSQDETNFNTQWGTYRDTIGKIDQRVKDMSPIDFYLKFSPARDRDLYILIGTAVARNNGIPKAYSKGNRSNALSELNKLLDECRIVLADFRSVEIKDQDVLNYRQERIVSVSESLLKSASGDWSMVRSAATPDYLSKYNDGDINLLKNISAKMINITSEVKRMSKYVDLEDRIAQRLASIDDDAERERISTSMRNSVNVWSKQLADIGQQIGRILTALKMTEQHTADTVKAYRRTVDIIINR